VLIISRGARPRRARQPFLHVGLVAGLEVSHSSWLAVSISLGTKACPDSLVSQAGQVGELRGRSYPATSWPGRQPSADAPRSPRRAAPGRPGSPARCRRGQRLCQELRRARAGQSLAGTEAEHTGRARAWSRPWRPSLAKVTRSARPRWFALSRPLARSASVHVDARSGGAGQGGEQAQHQLPQPQPMSSTVLGRGRGEPADHARGPVLGQRAMKGETGEARWFSGVWHVASSVDQHVAGGPANSLLEGLRLAA